MRIRIGLHRAPAPKLVAPQNFDEVLLAIAARDAHPKRAPKPMPLAIQLARSVLGRPVAEPKSNRPLGGAWIDDPAFLGNFELVLRNEAARRAARRLHQ